MYNIHTTYIHTISPHGSCDVQIYPDGYEPKPRNPEGIHKQLHLLSCGKTVRVHLTV